MKWDDLDKRQQWWVTGFMALKLWNQWLLVAICALVTSAGFFYPMLQIRELYGKTASAIFYAATYFLSAKHIGFWIINPICGLVSLNKIQRSYGPLTRRQVQEWFVEWCYTPIDLYDGSALDIAQFARANGEGK
ncbi:hypothetical protein [Pseudomonas putida]|uniref:Uncharacterized protein n=1 Tax=Pseudomonas putida TaxID=303 RepID=A0A1L7NP12_PSEPU|nr:hypothetical protein [Pseudomonas putida]BAW27181.1 Uncharacterized protein KF715C_pB750 [Pseudomonas putida]